jgi:hypothetical protein
MTDNEVGGRFESSALGTPTGSDALLAFANGYVAAFTGRHCTRDFVIDVDGDDAGSRCCLIAVNNAAAPIISATAVYEDVLRRTPDAGDSCTVRSHPTPRSTDPAQAGLVGRVG